jgi:O-acetyl-ADP-ribose deacetylase (regulator of RNase III)
MLERIATPRPDLRGHDNGVSRVGDVLVQLEHKDICTATTDVIVSAANEQLEMEQGVAHALRMAGGDEIQREARAQAPITMGQVVWTRSGRLHCSEVAHAAAALDGAICVQRAVLRTLFEAERRGHRSITFPALGTGVGGVPHGLGARLLLEAIRTFAGFQPRNVREIHVALPSPDKLAQWTSTVVAIDAQS